MDTQTLKRLNEIRAALRKYGFDKVLGQTTINRINPLKDEEEETQILLDSELPEKLRLMLQELGTTFIKFGQLLSTRPDIIGDKIANELTKLQDDNPAISYEEVKDIIENELDGKIDDFFAEFRKENIATASIGQVHEAKLITGERVAVKVQKSGITEKIDVDLDIMKFIAIEADRLKSLKKLNLPGIIDEFDRSIHKEIDYNNELMNMRRIEENSKNNPNIHIPISYPEYSTTKVLTMEFIDGEKLSNVYKSESPKYDKKLLARNIVESYLNQIFIDGFFHGDPHPGNIMILENNIVCYIDLGMMGLLDEEFKENLAQLMILFSDKDIDGLINQLMFMDILDYDADTKSLKRDLNDLFGRYYGVELNRFDGILEDLISLMQDYDVILPNEIVIMSRGLSMVESIAQNLDPRIDIFAFIKPIANKLIRRRLSPKKYFNDKKSSFFLYQHMVKTLPKLLTRTIHKIEEGELIFKLEVDKIDRITNKVILIIFASALIIASSTIISVSEGPMIYHMRVFGIIGIILSFAIVFYTIIRYRL